MFFYVIIRSVATWQSPPHYGPLGRVGDGGFDLPSTRSCHCEPVRTLVWQSQPPLLPTFVWCGGWWIRFAFSFVNAKENICSHQFLNWWQQVSTGHLHLDGFESHHLPTAKQKHQPLRLVFCFGGGWWILTTEGIASRFTVCPLWPLGKSPLLSCCLNGAGRRTRTPDLLITNQLLYQLSYTGGSNRTRLL